MPSCLLFVCRHSESFCPFSDFRFTLPHPSLQVCRTLSRISLSLRSNTPARAYATLTIILTTQPHSTPKGHGAQTLSDCAWNNSQTLVQNMSGCQKSAQGRHYTQTSCRGARARDGGGVRPMGSAGKHDWTQRRVTTDRRQRAGRSGGRCKDRRPSEINCRIHTSSSLP